jgi:hypothetical protein
MISKTFTGRTETEVDRELSHWLTNHKSAAIIKKHTTTTYRQLDGRMPRESGEIMNVAITIQYNETSN